MCEDWGLKRVLFCRMEWIYGEMLKSFTVVINERRGFVFVWWIKRKKEMKYSLFHHHHSFRYPLLHDIIKPTRKNFLLIKSTSHWRKLSFALSLCFRRLIIYLGLFLAYSNKFLFSHKMHQIIGILNYTLYFSTNSIDQN